MEGLRFGAITVDGKTFDTDVVIARGAVRERDKKPSRAERGKYGHTPLTPREDIPWDCKVLLIGIGMDGQLPVVDELKKEAEKRGVKLILLKTPEAVEHLKEHYTEDMNAILHVTC
ncbi:MAG: hypothetical protein HY721_06750 [Planctomycetes bacterium]|nr:hypothetical protein [Planctomycetota bacterium]